MKTPWFIVVTLLAIGAAIGGLLANTGPVVIKLHSPSGIEYACMYETDEDFVTITYELTHGELQ